MFDFGGLRNFDFLRGIFAHVIQKKSMATKTNQQASA